MSAPLVLKCFTDSTGRILLRPSPSQQNPSPLFYEQVASNKIVDRRKLVQSVSEAYPDSLTDRIAAYRALKAPDHNDPVIPGQERPGEEPKQDRPEIEALGRHKPRDYSDRSSPDNRSGYEIARQQAQFLIDSASQPVSLEEWRAQAGRITPHGQISY